MTILERELSNSDLIYIYWEQDGKWYAYEQSAFYLSQMMLGVSLGRYVMEDTLWLAKAEVDVSRISHEKYYQLQQNGICITLYPSQWIS